MTARRMRTAGRTRRPALLLKATDAGLGRAGFSSLRFMRAGGRGGGVSGSRAEPSAASPVLSLLQREMQRKRWDASSQVDLEFEQDDGSLRALAANVRLLCSTAKIDVMAFESGHRIERRRRSCVQCNAGSTSLRAFHLLVTQASRSSLKTASSSMSNLHKNHQDDNLIT